MKRLRRTYKAVATEVNLRKSWYNYANKIIGSQSEFKTVQGVALLIATVLGQPKTSQTELQGIVEAKI